MFRSLYSRIAAVLCVVLVTLAVAALALTGYTTNRYRQEAAQKLNAQLDMAPVHRFLDGGAPLPLLGDDPRSVDRHKVFSAAPVRGERGLEGYLYVILGGEDHDGVLDMLRGSYTLKHTGAVLAISVLLALLAGLALLRWLTARLRRLSDAMQDFERGNVPVPGAPEAGAERDEIGRLEATFHGMAGRIHEQIEQLRSTDEMRRDLVANVSHDLRTPLATLQTCIETALLKESSLGAAQRREFLELALAHSRRLDRLVQDLFDLARLDATSTVPHPETFPLADLVQDVVQKFRLPAAQRGIDVTAELGEPVPFVRADIALVERVLENLIENALRHTPGGGRVAVALEHRGNRVRVQVSDTGCGIAEGDLRRIFERSYRVDKSRSPGTQAGGLGLAIVKRILEVHGSGIDVQSEVDRGTTFEFGLPVSAGRA